MSKTEDAPNAPNARLACLLSEAENAPSLPAVALEVLRISEDEEASLDDLAAVIALDPALAAKLMRYANSTLYNPGSEVTTLQRAAMLLGLKAVQLTALSFSLTESIPKAGCGQFNYDRFWRRSSLRAVAARCFAHGTGSLMPDEAFLCGLIAEFGQIALAECLGQEYDPVLEGSKEGLPSRQLELECLGFDHLEALDAILKEWSFPHSIRATLSQALGHSNQEIPTPEDSTARVLVVACMATDLLSLEAPSVSLRELELAAQEQLDLSVEQTHELLDTLEAGVLELDRLLGLKLPVERGISKVLRLARANPAMMPRRAEARCSIGMEIHAELDSGVDADRELHEKEALEYYLMRSIEARLDGVTQLPIGMLHIEWVPAPGDCAVDVQNALEESLQQRVRPSDLWAQLSAHQFGVILNEGLPIGLRRLAEGLQDAIASLVSTAGTAPKLCIGGACIGPVGSALDGPQLMRVAERLAEKARTGSPSGCLVHPQLLRSKAAPRKAS